MSQEKISSSTRDLSYVQGKLSEAGTAKSPTVSHIQMRCMCELNSVICFPFKKLNFRFKKIIAYI